MGSRVVDHRVCFHLDHSPPNFTLDYHPSEFTSSSQISQTSGPKKIFKPFPTSQLDLSNLSSAPVCNFARFDNS